VNFLFFYLDSSSFLVYRVGFFMARGLLARIFGAAFHHLTFLPLWCILNQVSCSIGRKERLKCPAEESESSEKLQPTSARRSSERIGIRANRVLS
jgi:hypothetical protein